ncbi:MAG: nitroreductase [Capnocytophaga sp.]|nr:nitroreductase [Capnocytophaga sp.]
MSFAKILKQIIKDRKSTFPAEYSAEEIPENIIQDIVESASYAPNHKKTKPWRFKIFRSEEKEQLGKEMQALYKKHIPADKFSEAKYTSIVEKVKKADTLVTISVNFSKEVPEWEEIAAVAMAVQNMYLMSTAHQVGCYWSSPKFVKHLHSFLKLEENQECYGVFFIGSVN